MADFRKWLVAFAVVAILLGLATTASAAIINNPPLTCNFNSSAPRQVRGEGVAELVGDFVITCTGGTPTAPGDPVPLTNLHVQLQVPITSRIVGTATAPAGSKYNASEALLMIDEPFPADPFPPGATGVPGAASPQVGCVATGGQVSNNPYMGSAYVGVCEIPGTGGGSTYNGVYNTFQGLATTNLTTKLSTIDFNGVPIDPPGSVNERVIRITNVRGDMTGLLGPNNGANGVAVLATISVSGQQNLTFAQPTLTVAYVYQGLVGGAVVGNSFVQCLAPPTQACYDYVSTHHGRTTCPADAYSIVFAEGFASSFKTQQITDSLYETTDGDASDSVLGSIRWDGDGGFEPQNVPGLNYYTETGFTPDTDGELVADDPDAGYDSIGVADSGTRFLIDIKNLQNGVALFFPGEVDGTDTADNSPDLYLFIVPDANADGTGGAPDPTKDIEVDGSWTATSGDTHEFITYEVMGDDPNLIEQVTITPGITYAPDLTKPVPALGANETPSIAYATVSFAPIAADRPGAPLPPNDGKTNTTKRASLPRFINSALSPAVAVTISPCSCNLLFPWVVSSDGYDTGLAVVNTSWGPTIWPADTSQTGTITLWFYGTRAGDAVQGEYHPNTTATPAEAAITVPAGCAFTLIMSLGDGTNCVPTPTGNGKIDAAVTAGFVGYIIATTTFQYCHGVAYVTPQNDPFHGSYYEAIELDEPFALQGIVSTGGRRSGTGITVVPATRTGQWGESQAH
jgi:hypothetical protein